MVTLTLTAGAVCLLISAVEPQELTIQTENSRINVTVGSNAFFSVRPSAELDRGNWKFGETTLAQWVGTGLVITGAYRTRAELFLPNGSLLLKSVTASDSGDYTVTMIPSTGTQPKVIITLLVLVEPQEFTVHTENSRINVTVGRNAFFSVRPSAEVKSGYFKFGETAVALWIATTKDITNAYKTRAELFLPNGSLLLKSVTGSDRGDYTVTMRSSTGAQATATITLDVLDETNGDNNISSVAIAGIAIAALVIVSLIGGITAWLVKRKTAGMNGRAQGGNEPKSTVNGISDTVGANSAVTYENIPRKQKDRAPKPRDESSTYMGLQLQDQSVYSDLMRH